MNYTLNQLQIFIKVVQLESVTKASEDLFMTQPAVSIQLKNFQDQFDIPLTESVGRNIRITEFGREVYEMALKIMDEVAAINQKTTVYKGLLAGKLRLSIASTGKYIMPYFLSQFYSLHPEIELIMDVTNKTAVIESLEKNAIDFALVSVLPDELKIDEEILMDSHLYLIGNEYFFEKSKENTTNDANSIFENAPLIFREKGSATRISMEKFLAKNDLVVRKKIELTSNEAVKQSVLAGLGVSIMPLIGIKNELLTCQLKIIPIAGLPIKSQWRLVWLKNKKFSPVAQEFLNFIRNNKTHIWNDNFSWKTQFTNKPYNL